MVHIYVTINLRISKLITNFKYQSLNLILFRCSMSKSFQVSVIPGKHQCMQSSCFFPPDVDGWASALNSLMRVMSKIWKPDPLRALYRCSFTRRASTFVPLFFNEKISSTWKVNQDFQTFVVVLQNKSTTTIEVCR